MSEQKMRETLDKLRTVLCDPEGRACVKGATDADNAEIDAALDMLEALSQREAQEPVACLVGMKGSAYDTTETKRAYTYAEQPGNVVASKLGGACIKAGSSSDTIDLGLSLLKVLQDAGFGVFAIGAEYTAAPSREVPEEWAEVMRGLVECARDELVRCEGMKCREPNCISCNSEQEAFRSIERSREFTSRARDLLASNGGT